MIKRLYYILLQRLYVMFDRKPCQGKVYMFHNVNDENDTYSITADNFEKFLEYLTGNKRIVDAETLIREKDPENVVLTFDDVYESVYLNAYPLLKKKDVPYYLFVCNEYLDKDKYVSKKMLEEMLNNSRAILGSHGYRHELFRFYDKNQLKKELNDSKEELNSMFSAEIESMAFPYGSMYACSKENIETASHLFNHVFMTYGVPYNESMKKVIPRININDNTFEREMK